MTTTEARPETDSGTKTVRTYCAECGARCGVLATIRDGELLKVIPDRSHPNKGFCIKGEAGPEKLYNEGRILYPMKRTNPKTDPDPGWQRISWDEAFDTISTNLLRIREESGPEAVAFTRPAVAGSGSIDWAHWLIRLSRAFGSPNFIATGHICQWARDTGSQYTYGSGLPKPDYEHAKTIVIWGNNPAVTEVQNWLRIRDAHRDGAKLIVIDPRRTETASSADLWLSVTPGTDAPLALGLIRIFLDEGLFNDAFVRNWTNAPFLIDRSTGLFLHPADAGLDGPAEAFVVQDEATGALSVADPRFDFAAQGLTPALFVDRELSTTNGAPARIASALQLLRESVASYTLASVSAETGLAEADIASMARMIGQGTVAYYTHNGVEQHVNTMETNRALCILFGMTGSFDELGGNVQFSGAPKHEVDGHELLTHDMLQRRVGMEVRPLGGPRNAVQAYMFYEAILQAQPYKMRGLVGFGANMLMQNGDTMRGKEALEALEFFVHADMFESPTSRFADILLPAATCWESPGLANSFGGSFETNQYIQYKQALVAPRGESRPDVEILFGLAERLGLADAFWGGDYKTAYNHQLAPAGLTLADLEDGEPVKVDAAVKFHKYSNLDDEGHVRGFNTQTKRIEIYSEMFLRSGLGPLPSYVEPAWKTIRRGRSEDEFPLILTTAKVTAFVHSSGRGIPTLRRQHPEPFVELHPETAAFCAVEDRDTIRVTTPQGSIMARAMITDKVIPGIAVTQTGWWEACEELNLPPLDPFAASGANLNFVVNNDLIDPISGSVPGKSYACRISPVKE